MRSVAQAVLVSVLLGVVSSGCVNYQARANKQMAEVRGKMKACLDACRWRMTKAQLTQQVGLPTAKQPRQDGGEQWVYEYARQNTVRSPDNIVHIQGQTRNMGGGGAKTYHFKMVVTIGFGKNGIMDNWSTRGHTGSFPTNPFTRLRPPARALPAGASRSTTPGVSGADMIKRLKASCARAILSKRVTQAEIVRQAGQPASRTPAADGGEVWRYKYHATPADGIPRYAQVDVQFNARGIMAAGGGYNGQFVHFPNLPFYSLKVPAAPTAAPAPAAAAKPVVAKGGLRIVKGVMVTSADSPGVMVKFDSFPKGGLHFRWQGEALNGFAHGQGVVRVLDNWGKDLGAYVGTFTNSKPGADVECIINEENRTALPEMNLGGVPWK